MSWKRWTRQKPTLAIRLAAGVAIITGACFLASTTIIYMSLSATIHQRLDIWLLHEASELDSVVSLQQTPNVQRVLSEMANAEGTGTVFYRVADTSGNVVAESDATAWQGVYYDQDIAKRAVDSPQFQTVALHPGSDSLRIMYAVMGSDMFLQAAIRQQHELQPLQDLRRLNLIVAGVALIASCAMGWIAAKRLLRPLDVMTNTAQSIAAGNLDVRVSVATDDAELDRLASAFNVMLDKIQLFVREQREMNDSIAHDLRSALARIQLAADRLLATRPLSEEQESLGVAVTENATELLGMLDTIMDLSELNTGVIQLPDGNVDIDALLGEIVELFGMSADEKNVALTLEADEGATVRGDPNRLRRAVANLVDNAVKYTEAGGRIVVRTRSESNTVVIVVSDTGIGIPENDLAHVFKRFYRVDKSRGSAGHGLGLSLTDAIVRLHGGTISVESTQGSGTTFVVALPLV